MRQDVEILDTFWQSKNIFGRDIRHANLPVVQSMLCADLSMTTTLLVLGAVWMGSSVVFCLALCVAAARPIPQNDVEEQFIEPERESMEVADENAVCVR